MNTTKKFLEDPERKKNQKRAERASLLAPKQNHSSTTTVLTYSNVVSSKNPIFFCRHTNLSQILFEISRIVCPRRKKKNSLWHVFMELLSIAKSRNVAILIRRCIEYSLREYILGTIQGDGVSVPHE